MDRVDRSEKPENGGWKFYSGGGGHGRRGDERESFGHVSLPKLGSVVVLFFSRGYRGLSKVFMTARG